MEAWAKTCLMRSLLITNLEPFWCQKNQKGVGFFVNFLGRSENR